MTRWPRPAEPLGIDIDIATHDAGRMFAKLTLKRGAGWSRLSPVWACLGVEQHLTDAPCDRLGLRLSWRGPLTTRSNHPFAETARAPPSASTFCTAAASRRSMLANAWAY
jgi:hypothetical protein